MSTGSDKMVRIGEAAKILGVSVQTMRNWEKSGKLPASRSEGNQRYYLISDLDQFTLEIDKLGWAWATSGIPPDLPKKYYCERQDRFTSRVDRLVSDLQIEGTVTEDIVSLLGLVIGEIGDNSFAHNLGNWPDIPGIFFAYNLKKRIMVLADRGRGVKATLSRVRPGLDTDMQALEVAFTEILSGREPEKRGNGLKVVRSVVESSQIGLTFRSGLGLVTIPSEKGVMNISMATENVRGTYAIIIF